jgi:hypothetical protein
MITLQTSMRHTPETVYNVEIEKGKSIRIFGIATNRREPKPYDKTFKIGDWAEYGSYNLRYIGQIVSIGEKTVTIQHEHGTERSRLKIAEFCWRNYDFDLEEVRRHNSNELQYI